MKTIHYGLRHITTDTLVTYYTQSNVGGQMDTQHILSLSDYNYPWEVKSPEEAEYVRTHSTRWYSAGHDTPTHSFQPDELEVVKITKEVIIERA